MRGARFEMNGFDLPQVEVPTNWWDRFNIAPDARCEVSDSNMYSGLVEDGREFDHVWLFDAHHDLFRIKDADQLVEFLKEGRVSCEDWMFIHYANGAKLHWRYPRWFTYGKQMRHEVPKFVGCDSRKDDMGKLDPNMRFDAVSICRSGAWVPPWCDPAFEQFWTSCPAGEIVQVDSEDNVNLMRKWNPEEITKLAEDMTKMEAQMRADAEASQ
jgi:hypothetical protein